MSETKITFLLVDDHSAVRKTLADLIEMNPMYRVVAHAPDGATAIELAIQLVPDIMFVDINMAPMNGFKVTEITAASLPTIRIIGFSTNNDPWTASRLISLGARGYLTKTVSFEELVLAVEKIINGEIYICEEVRKAE